MGRPVPCRTPPHPGRVRSRPTGHGHDRGHRPDNFSEHDVWWMGWIAFAGMMMLLLGSFHAIQGLVALFNDEYFLVAQSGSWTGQSVALVPVQHGAVSQPGEHPHQHPVELVGAVDRARDQVGIGP